MSPRICVLALIGLPAAGKSAFCQYLLSSTLPPFNVAHLCFDNFLPSADFGTQQQSSENFNFKMERSRILTLLQTLVNKLKSSAQQAWSFLSEHKIAAKNNKSQDYVILCDDNNYYTSMRYKIYQLCRLNQLFYGQLYFPIALPVALQRNSQRCDGEKVPAYILEQMCERLQKPNKQKNLWESSTIEMHSNSCSDDLTIAPVANFIAEIFQNDTLKPTPATPVDVQAEEHHTTNSPLHTLDITLRRCIKDILQQTSLSAESKQIMAKQLNEKRKEILKNKSQCAANETESLINGNADDLIKLYH